MDSPALETLAPITSQFPLPAKRTSRSSSKQSSPTSDAAPLVPTGRKESSELRRTARENSSAEHSFVSVDNASSGGSHGLPPPIPYANGSRQTPPPQIDTRTHASLMLTDTNLLLSPFPPMQPSSSGAESGRGSLASKGTGGSRSLVDTHSAPPEGAWFGDAAIGPRNEAPKSPRTRQNPDDTQSKLQRHLEESMSFHERLKADNAALLQRIIDQEQEMSRQREAHVKHVSDCSQDVQELREALAKAQQRRFAEEDSLVAEYKALAARAEQQAMQAREQSLAELQRMLGVVERLTKEKESAHKRLKVIKRALSSESLLLTARNSFVGPPREDGATTPKI
jgi:hypothetical protein